MIDIKITIGHLYPDLLNLYSDRGNITALLCRLRWRGFEADARAYSLGDDIDFSALDIVLLGGGAEHEQALACKRLRELRDDFAGYVERGDVTLALCGGYQLLGEYFPSGGTTAEGLNILDIRTENEPERFVGNVVAKSHLCDMPVVGFENHSGRTYTGAHEPLGRLVAGRGNNGEDGREGVVYKNLIGTYLHGPLLPKNPQLCDWLLQKAVGNKGYRAALEPLDDSVEISANRYISERFGGKSH